jgi:dihydrofolate reductase
MGRLIYITNTSLDLFIEDESGAFDFSVPSDEQFDFITDLIRPVDTFVYGRKLYETMAVWETDPSLAQQSDRYAEFARVWTDSDKLVHSSALESTPTVRTRVTRSFDVDEIRALKAEQLLCIGGADIAAQAWRAGLVDECHLFVSPVLLGRGKPALPDDVRTELELMEERRFGGVVYLRYRVR